MTFSKTWLPEYRFSAAKKIYARETQIVLRIFEFT